MKSKISTWIIALSVFAALATPIRLVGQAQPEHSTKQTHYTITNLGSLGGTNCCLVITNNNRGWVDGTSNLAGDQSFHPFLWRDGNMQDLGTLGGPNASAGGMNDRGDVTVGGGPTPAFQIPWGRIFVVSVPIKPVSPSCGTRGKRL